MSNYDLYQMHRKLSSRDGELTISQFVNRAVNDYAVQLSTGKFTHDDANVTYISSVRDCDDNPITCRLIVCRSRDQEDGERSPDDVVFFAYRARRMGFHWDTNAVRAIKIGTIWIIADQNQRQDRCFTIDAHGTANFDADSRALLDLLPLTAIKSRKILPTFAPKPKIHFFPADFPRGSPIILSQKTVIRHCSHKFLSGSDEDRSEVIKHDLDIGGFSDDVVEAVTLTLEPRKPSTVLAPGERTKEEIISSLGADDYAAYLILLDVLGARIM